MIINLRGTSGSGKSTLARAVFAEYEKIDDHFIEGRRQPYWTTFKHPKGGRPLAVLGHYNTACGGTDTINGFDKIYDLARACAESGYDVLMEGLLLSAEVARAIELAATEDVFVLHIDIPLQECIDSVNQRRWAKDPEKPGVNPKNTESKWKGTHRCCERLEEAGIEVHRGNREDCRRMALELLGVR